MLLRQALSDKYDADKATIEATQLRQAGSKFVTGSAVARSQKSHDDLMSPEVPLQPEHGVVLIESIDARCRNRKRRCQLCCRNGSRRVDLQSPEAEGNEPGSRDAQPQRAIRNHERSATSRGGFRLSIVCEIGSRDHQAVIDGRASVPLYSSHQLRGWRSVGKICHPWTGSMFTTAAAVTLA